MGSASGSSSELSLRARFRESRGGDESRESSTLMVPMGLKGSGRAGDDIVMEWKGDEMKEGRNYCEGCKGEVVPMLFFLGKANSCLKPAFFCPTLVGKGASKSVLGPM